MAAAGCPASVFDCQTRPPAMLADLACEFRAELAEAAKWCRRWLRRPGGACLVALPSSVKAVLTPGRKVQFAHIVATPHRPSQCTAVWGQAHLSASASLPRRGRKGRTMSQSPVGPCTVHEWGRNWKKTAAESTACAPRRSAVAAKQWHTRADGNREGVSRKWHTHSGTHAVALALPRPLVPAARAIGELSGPPAKRAAQAAGEGKARERAWRSMRKKGKGR